MSSTINEKNIEYRMSNLSTRKYTMTDGELAMFASNLNNTISRNMADFTKYGVSADRLTDFETMLTQFSEFPVDDFYLGDVVLATATKDAKEEEVKEMMREMALRVDMKWGENSGQYKRLGIVGMNDFREDKLLMNARSMHKLMTEYLPNLANQGLTEAVLTAFETLNAEYESARNDQHKAMDTRFTKSEERVQLGNELYNSVSIYCKLGRKIYRNKSLARYNEFVMYQASAGTVSVPQDFQYDYTSGTFRWQDVKNSTSYIVDASADGTDYYEIFSGQDTYFQYKPGTEGWSYYKIRARNNNGTGDYSVPLKVGYYESALPAPKNITIAMIDEVHNQARVSWDETPAATLYKVYKSEVAIGAAANSFELVGTAIETKLNLTLAANKRTYIQMTAESDRLWSPRSTMTYIDVVD